MRIFRPYRFVDFATQTYLALVAVLVLAFHGDQVARWRTIIAAHAAVMLAIHALLAAHRRRPKSRPLDFLRHFYPIILYTALYKETSLLNRMFVDHYLDRFFMRVEAAIFGCQPSVRFMELLPWLPVSELFHAAYFSYYAMIFGIGLALYLKNEDRFAHFVSIVSFVFYGCYLLFIFLPVIGPLLLQHEVPAFPNQTELPHYPLIAPAAVRSGPFFQVMRLIYRNFEAQGAAFPSSHVAVAFTTLYFSRRYLPAIRWPHLVLVTLLCLSTVYCRYHYAVDVPAGILAAAILIPAGERLRRAAGKIPNPNGGLRQNPRVSPPPGNGGG